MFGEYALPPGYEYEVAVDDGEVRLVVIDRAGDHVVSVPMDGFEGFRMIRDIVHEHPEWLRHHAPAFMVWHLNHSPLDRLIELEIGP